MFSNQALRIIITVALAAHAIAHAVALRSLVGQLLGGAASGVAVRAWLVPSFSPSAAAALAVPLWLVSTIGFGLAALAVWGVVTPQAWRQLAVGSALVSVAGIALFFGMWPGSPNLPRSILNTAVAVAMNAIVLWTQLWLRWPAGALLDH